MPSTTSISSAFAAHIADQHFPCVGAKSSLAGGGLTIVEVGTLASAEYDDQILATLQRTADAFWQGGELLRSVAIISAQAAQTDEQSFEDQLWRRLQALANRDAACGAPCDPDVSADPADPHFALSLGGHGYFVVGLHPAASRPARRFAHPVLIFNLQAQFAALRAQGIYEKMRDTIVQRDIDYSGSVNPMLARFGEASAAAQFSGRAVDADWRCPFVPPSRRSEAA